jgi:serine O-acetyltransferase
MSILQLLREDFERHGGKFNEPGLWILAAYRLSVRSAGLPAGSVRRLATAGSSLLSFVLGLATHTTIPTDVKVGERLHLIHAMSVSIAPGVRIGDRVGIMHDVTIGPSHERAGVPKIGNDVFIGVGAAILGPVNVGDGAMIAANSLVISDVPAGAFAVGVPAKVVRWGGATVAEETPRPAVAKIA